MIASINKNDSQYNKAMSGAWDCRHAANRAGPVGTPAGFIRTRFATSLPP